MLRYRRRVPSSESAAPGVSPAESSEIVPQSLIDKVRAALRQGGAFLVVGLLGFAVDAGTYNLLVFMRRCGAAVPSAVARQDHRNRCRHGGHLFRQQMVDLRAQEGR